jgi:hypothetical protein
MDWNLKLFEEIARSLRRVKRDHQPDITEPEAPTNAPGSEIILPSDAVAQRAGFSPELRETIRVIRRDVLTTLSQGRFSFQQRRRWPEREVFTECLSVKSTSIFFGRARMAL